MNRTRILYNKEEARCPNSTYPKGGVSCSKDSFVVNGTLVFQIKFCGKIPTLRVAAKRWLLGSPSNLLALKKNRSIDFF